jgi:hypothetical protein
MKQKSVFIGSDEFICTYFFNIDNQCDCVDVKDEQGNHLCEIIDISFPDDIDDEEENIRFDQRVEEELIANNLI